MLHSLLIASLLVLQADFSQARSPKRRIPTNRVQVPKESAVTRKPIAQARSPKRRTPTNRVQAPKESAVTHRAIYARDVKGQHDRWRYSEYNTAWAEVAEWIVKNGGNVTQAILGAPTQHSGIKMRGIVAGDKLKRGNFLEVPSKLWINIDSFPSLKKVDLSTIPGCEDQVGSIATMIKVSAGIALETKKKDKSFFWPYLQHLPDLEHYKASYPRLAEEQLLKDFRGLPLVGQIKGMQDADHQLEKCFYAWQKDHSGQTEKISDITWDEFFLALNQFRTRAYDTPSIESGSLIPAADLMNPALQVNTERKPHATSFNVGAGALRKGAELFDFYCPRCDNSVFLAKWGVYLEENDNMLQEPKMGCDKFTAGVQKQLEDVLDMRGKRIRELKKMGWQAPRCKSSLLTQPQGPLRCSMARLSWQVCHHDGSLDKNTGKNSMAQILVDPVHNTHIPYQHDKVRHPHSAIQDRTFADLLDRSSRQRVELSLYAPRMMTPVKWPSAKPSAKGKRLVRQ